MNFHAFDRGDYSISFRSFPLFPVIDRSKIVYQFGSHIYLYNMTRSEVKISSTSEVCVEKEFLLYSFSDTRPGTKRWRVLFSWFSSSWLSSRLRSMLYLRKHVQDVEQTQFVLRTKPLLDVLALMTTGLQTKTRAVVVVR